MRFLALSTIIAWLLAAWWGVGALRGPGVASRLRRLLLALGCAGLGALLAMGLVFVRVAVAFSGETLVARVTTRRLSPQEFELTYIPASGGETAVKTLRLRGDQWAISGGVVKWHPWLTALGLPSYHKPIRLSGQFADVAQQRAQAPTVYALEPGVDRVWEWLYRLDPYLPFVEAVYGSSAYAYAEPRATQDVYVTPSGYLIKRRRPAHAARSTRL